MAIYLCEWQNTLAASLMRFDFYSTVMITRNNMFIPMFSAGPATIVFLQTHNALLLLGELAEFDMTGPYLAAENARLALSTPSQAAFNPTQYDIYHQMFGGWTFYFCLVLLPTGCHKRKRCSGGVAAISTK